VSDDPRPVEERLRALGASAVPVDVRDEARRTAAVRAIEKGIVEAAKSKQRRKRVRRTAGLAAAALVLLGVGLSSWKVGRDMGERSATVAETVSLSVRGSSGAVVVKRGTAAHLLEEQHEFVFGAGDKVETLADGRLELANDHSLFQVDRATRLELVAAGRSGEHLRLSHGHLDVEVRHLRERKVVIETPHGEVLVVGTAFGVTVEGEGPARQTRVDVEHGTVWILQNGERRAVVEAGQRWSSETAPAPVRLPDPPRASPSVTPSVSPIPAPAEAGTLAEENRLFRAALDARNRGDGARSAELFGELLRRFPRSVVAEEASLGRLRALERLGRRVEAQGEARRYLARFPGGHARAEVEKLLAPAADAADPE
jgi:ferric-dicitrate binding protein FerR (iron transport regulator)